MNCEWPTDKILRFVDEYKNRPLLWDRDHCHNRIPDRKLKAWEEMAEIFHTDIWELKKKMDSLLASYRRERQKVKIRSAKMRTTAEKEDIVNLSTWFAYPAFRFLHDKYLERKAKMKLIQDEPDDSIELETSHTLLPTDFIKTEEEIVHPEEDLLNGLDEQVIDEYLPQQIPPQSQQPPRKRYKPNNEDIIFFPETVLHNSASMANTSANNVPRKDHCDAFGEYLSEKMRNFDEQTKCVVQYLISNVLFQADMGKFKNKDFNYENLVENVIIKSVNNSKSE